MTRTVTTAAVRCAGVVRMAGDGRREDPAGPSETRLGRSLVRS
jgi:hypothetical protein